MLWRWWTQTRVRTGTSGEKAARFAPDPGMDTKMGPAGFADLPDLVAGRPVDVGPLLDRARFVDSRIDCADFRALTLVRALHADRANGPGGDREAGLGADHARAEPPDDGARPGASPSPDDAARPSGPAPWRLPDEVRARLEDSLVGFRYSHDVPGSDSMCLWSENHQVVAAVAEHCAGLLMPDRRFTASGRTGAEHAALAAYRLRTWLADRFAIGFIEWLSPTYYEEDTVALAVLIDLTDDAALAERARAILDLLSLDLALHARDGVLAGSAGRAYTVQKQFPRSQEIAPIISLLLGPPEGGTDGTDTIDGVRVGGAWSPDTLVGDTDDPAGSRAADRLGGLMRSASYTVPPVLRSLAADPGPLLVRQSFGLDLDEVPAFVGAGAGVEREALVRWAMESFTDPESTISTMRIMRQWNLWDNRFLAPFSGFRPIPDRLLPAIARVLDPATNGISLTRADVTTWRLRDLALSSAQGHRPGRHGDQQHIWQALLPGAVPVFATHPGRALFTDVARSFSPSDWTGNGRLPDTRQDGQVLLSLHRLNARHGYLEPPRLRWTHLYWPSDRFDRHDRGDHWAVARSGDGLVGVRSLEPMRQGESDELIQAGTVTAWAVVVAGEEEAGGFEAFREAVRSARFTSGRGGRRIAFSMGGHPVPDDDAGSATPVPRGHGASGHGTGSGSSHAGGLPSGTWRLDWRAGLSRDGRAVDREFPRLEVSRPGQEPHIRVERFPGMIEIDHGGHQLVLTGRGREAAT
jgi:hypothetical protein